jgi:hypothetical protein
MPKTKTPKKRIVRREGNIKMSKIAGKRVKKAKGELNSVSIVCRVDPKTRKAEVEVQDLKTKETYIIEADVPQGLDLYDFAEEFKQYMTEKYAGNITSLVDSRSPTVPQA